MDLEILFRYTVSTTFADPSDEPGVAYPAERKPSMILAVVIALTMLLALAAVATLLKTEPAPVRVRVDDVERLRRRR